MSKRIAKFLISAILIILAMSIYYKIDTAKNFLELAKVIIKSTLSITVGYILVKIKEMK
jgi:hypothetical protein|nr:MAG TPA: hypothetical protein [Caudoviricetes sp.]DAT15682.1 MAG TPA: hypothetical protein [Caudoviricetes sp.]